MLIVVVVPFTVRSEEIITLPPTFKVLPSKVKPDSAFMESVPDAVRILLLAPLAIKSETSTLKVVPAKSNPEPAEYVVSVEAIVSVSEPAAVVRATLLPAANVRVSVLLSATISD